MRRLRAVFQVTTELEGKMEFIGPSGEKVWSDPKTASLYADNCRKTEEKKQQWIDILRDEGIKAAHPDDGWINRKESSFQFIYPQFNDGVSIGDLVALGWPDKYRIIKITDIRQGFLKTTHYDFVSNESQ